MGVKLAVVGVTGAVGCEMRKILEERNFPCDRVRFFASERSEGREVRFRNETYRVEALRDSVFKGMDFALFSIPKEMSRVFSPIAARNGCVVVDNSNAFRMDNDVPLVVPEVNAYAIFRHKGIIANPNCSTIQMVVVLYPLHRAATIKRIVVTTFQAVSGVGLRAMEELRLQSGDLVAGSIVNPQVFPHQIAFNVIPQIPNRDAFGANRYSSEEMKMVNETRKIMEAPSIRITATTVRVPVFGGHSESVNIETDRKLTVEDARRILSNAPGVEVMDDPGSSIYPMPILAEGKDPCYVGRIREDESIACGLNLWIVADNLRKGAALNAIQIAERLLAGK